MIKKIIRNMLASCNLEVYKMQPRYSTIFARNYFKSKSIKAMEIGTWKGDNAKSILKELNINNLILVDPYKWYDGFERKHGRIYDTINMDKLYLKVKRIFEDYENVRVIRDKSSELNRNEIGDKFDFIYIDGNHEYKFVKEDIIKFYDFVRKGGILAGHDFTYSTSNGAIIDAVTEFLKDKNNKLYVMGSDWWIIK
jgi:predicted O-methyltransferase YrrM